MKYWIYELFCKHVHRPHSKPLLTARVSAARAFAKTGRSRPAPWPISTNCRTRRCRRPSVFCKASALCLPRRRSSLFSPGTMVMSRRSLMRCANCASINLPAPTLARSASASWPCWPHASWPLSVNWQPRAGGRRRPYRSCWHLATAIRTICTPPLRAIMDWPLEHQAQIE
jgi:hypothetical protein